MIRYGAAFALIHLLGSALVGYFTWWRENHGGIVGGGGSIICIFVGVQAASAYFVRREGRMPSPSETWIFLTLAVSYVVILSTFGIWILMDYLPVLSQSGWLVAIAFVLVTTLAGFWASKPAALGYMQKYLKMAQVASPNTSLERTREG